jgi:tRNA1(Val) A37 N6-methylase TrmN6
MSIVGISIKEYKQEFEASKNKEKYGEINTDFQLIIDMLKIIPKDIFKNSKLKWLDPCCGRGYFMIVLFHKLYKSLKEKIPDDIQRKKHIIEKMLYMVEINNKHISKLKEIFGENANIFNIDFLSFDSPQYDIIIGNPPYNINGLKKVPTNNKLNKLKDGDTIWPDFVKKGVSLLKKNGNMVMIIPSIWMRPDRAKMYNFLLQYKLSKIHCFTNTETNKFFHGKAQTPTCYFLLKKIPAEKFVTLYDSQVKIYTPWFLTYDTIPLPVFGSSILYKLQKFVRMYGSINVIKTNMPKKGTHFSTKFSFITPHSNIKTCLLDKNQPYLNINYSNKLLRFAGIPKLVLAHKMYGFPFLDTKGKYGISNRDNYIILDKHIENLHLLRDFLSTKFARYLFEGTRYRMKYLEKHIFELIPDIRNFYTLNQKITDDIIAKLFGLEPMEIRIINEFHKKEYLLCIEKSTKKKAPLIKKSQ